VSLPVLQDRIGSASLGLGGPINADTARRIACDAEIIPVVLGSRGEPLDVGRASRTVPTAIRRAVILRDGGCAFPGCSIPARWCDIHHGRHHRLIHHSDWRSTWPAASQNSIPRRGWVVRRAVIPSTLPRPGPNPSVAADSRRFREGREMIEESGGIPEADRRWARSVLGFGDLR
jgi:hypothetical protein